MSIVLYPRAAPNDRLRVWIGAFFRTQAPQLVWSIDGNPVNPTALREISSVRTNAMLGANPNTVRRTFTGVYEFTGLHPDTTYRINVRADGVQAPTLETRTLPPSVPSSINQSFNVLLVSCFHAAEDLGGLAGTVVSQLKASNKPQLTIMAGDQVYLDLPTLKNFPEDLVRLSDKFEGDYVNNWFGELAYAKLLAAAPSISSPDDHEYWNNFPHPSPFIQNSLSDGGQRTWKQAAQAMYEGFQLPYPASLGSGETLDVHPLSFFFADTRSKKDPGRAFTMSDDARLNLSTWVTKVINDRLYPVFVSGQSLFCKPAGKFTGAVGDYELANYRDYREIISTLRRLADAGIPLLCLTGDVHWGRVATTVHAQNGRNLFTEVISSPASLVETVGADQAKLAVAGVLSIFGKKNPWPRHADPAELPLFFAQDVLEKDFRCSWIHGQRGNHVVVLGFRQNGGGLELRVKYWPIHKDTQYRSPIELNPINLIRA